MLKKFSVTAGSALMAVVVGSGTASAATVVYTRQAVNVTDAPPAGAVCAPASAGGNVCFEKQGDKIWVKDTKKDGNYVRASWMGFWEINKEHRCHDHHGSDAGWTVCNYNMPENDDLAFRTLVINENGNAVPGTSAEVNAPTS